MRRRRAVVAMTALGVILVTLSALPVSAADVTLSIFAGTGSTGNPGLVLRSAPTINDQSTQRSRRSVASFVRSTYSFCFRLVGDGIRPAGLSVRSESRDAQS
jgi:hypothetical protein